MEEKSGGVPIIQNPREKRITLILKPSIHPGQEFDLDLQVDPGIPTDAVISAAQVLITMANDQFATLRRTGTRRGI